MKKNPACELAIDGGIRADNLDKLVECNPDVIVVSSAVFKHPGGITQGVNEVRDAISKATIKYKL
jgi:ribulose-phosphate 3-epimerase